MNVLRSHIVMGMYFGLYRKHCLRCIEGKFLWINFSKWLYQYYKMTLFNG